MWKIILLYLFCKGYFKCLDIEKMGSDIHVTTLCPGPTFTNFLAESFTEKDGEVTNTLKL